MRFLPVIAFVLTLFVLANPARADFAGGKAAYDRKDWPQAILQLRPLSEQGDAKASFLLANMYMQGYGVKKDTEQAFTLYRRAAVAGNAEAMVVVAALLQQGIGTGADINQAFAWYHRAALMGQPAGAFFYGLYLYRGNHGSDGRDIEPDHVQSYKWLRIAARQSKDAKIRDAATKMADANAKELKPEDVAKIDAEVAAFAPVSGDALGPLPDAQP